MGHREGSITTFPALSPEWEGHQCLSHDFAPWFLPHHVQIWVTRVGADLIEGPQE